ncbi:MAG: SRPBCC family protein [Streptosporangiaceae bacterium]
MDDSNLGTLTRQGDQWTLTFTRSLKHSQEKVWRAVTEPEHLAVWFPHEIIGERRAGAPLKFVHSKGDAFDGQMRVFDPPSVLEFTWGPDLLRIELQADGEGTLLTLTDTFDELGKAARDAAGWHECLTRLASDVDGESPAAWGSNWRQLNKLYQEHLGPEASVLGPPPGYDD